MSTIYDYTVPDTQGNDIPLSNYKGKVMIIVNTATGCGFTPHYKELEEMYRKYHDKGLEIIDIPCNQFAGQAPGTVEFHKVYSGQGRECGETLRADGEHEKSS